MGRKRKEPIVEEPDMRSSEGEESVEEEQRGGKGRKRARFRRGGGGGRSTAGTGGMVSTFFRDQHVKGSSRTLADLGLDAAGEEGESLRELLASLPERHRPEKAALRRRQHEQFGRWRAQLRAGNSLLLYGFGSKFELLSRFAREQARDGACLAVNGLQPGLTVRQILRHATAAIKDTRAADYRSGCSAEDLLGLIKEDPRRLYLALHNIDGPGLRDRAAQRTLSELAALPNVHLAASCDHANAALLWDQQTRDRFSWVWHNATNYAPYLREVAFAAIPSLLVGRSEQCSKQSASVVLASLSRSAREVFRLVADVQLDPSGEQGISFQRLFQRCRERFLVSNEMLLRAFLTEFRDHDLLGTKRAADGSELLHVPLEEEGLRGVLADVETMG